MLRLIAERVADYDVDGDRIARMHSANVRGFASLPSTAKAR